MVQLIDITNNLTATSSSISSFTRQANLDYAKQWHHDYLQVFLRHHDVVNRSSLLVDILQDHVSQAYRHLLLLPHEGIMMNELSRDLTKHNSYDKFDVMVSGCNDKVSRNMTSRPFWEDGITLWNLKNHLMGHPLSSLLSLATQLPRYDDHNPNPRISCFPKEDEDATYCNSHRVVPPPPPRWEWHYYMNETSSTTPNTTKNPERQRLLIAQYAGWGAQYSQMLQVSSHITKAYCRLWKNCDVVLLQGMPWKVDPYDDICGPPPPHRASFGKISVLEKALEHEYDQVLLLDADAMIVNFDMDLTRLLPNTDANHYLLMGHKVRDDDPSNETWFVNNGVTLWNLRHQWTRFVVADWSRRSTRKILKAVRKWSVMDATTRRLTNSLSPRRVGDQETMHDSLRENGLSWAVYASTEDFRYHEGSVIQHWIRGNNREWNVDSDTDVRYERLRNLSQEVCRKYSPACAGMD
jgi:hypothetical protein